MIRTPLLALSLVAVASAAGAQEAKVGALTVKGAVVRATPGGSANTAGYAAVVNAGAAPDTLVAAACDCAAKVELHEMSMAGGVMRMRRLDQGLTVPAHGSAALRPGGSHLMILGVKKPLKDGDRVKLTLTFAKAGTVTVEAPVKSQVGG
jgi:hypothetical protein